jgi:predicted lipoprotein with Yx(FWY)xxD motif
MGGKPLQAKQRQNKSRSGVFSTGEAGGSAGLTTTNEQGATSPMKRMMLGLTAALFLTGAAMGAAFAAEPAMKADSSLGKILVDSKGMTLYTFDNDGKGAKMSSCSGKCVAAWPPLLAPADAKAEGEWTVVDVTDKDGKPAKMWAYNGWPLYTFIKDAKPGDVTGDGVGGVWHVVKE